MTFALAYRQAFKTSMMKKKNFIKGIIFHFKSKMEVEWKLSLAFKLLLRLSRGLTPPQAPSFVQKW